MTGRTHTIFVQTRDRYGNYISTDPEEYPEGSDLIEFEYCSTVGQTCEGKEGCVCNDGEANPDVAIEVARDAISLRRPCLSVVSCWPAPLHMVCCVEIHFRIN